MEKWLVIAQNPCRSSFNNRGVHFYARVHIYKRLSTKNRVHRISNKHIGESMMTYQI